MKSSFVVVAALDFSTLGDRALQEAATLQDSHSDMELHVIVVGRSENEMIRMPCLDMAPLRQSDADEFACRHVGALIAKMHERGVAHALEHVTVYVATGDPAENIVELAGNMDADLIVLGTHGGDGLKRWILGSVAQEVARKATCGVYIIRPRDFLDGVPLPAVEPPLKPGEHALFPFKHRPTHHYVGRDSKRVSRVMPVI